VELLMGPGLVMAQGGDHLSRAADHAAVIGMVALSALLGGLVYGLVRVVAKSRAARTRSDTAPGGAGAPLGVKASAPVAARSSDDPARPLRVRAEAGAHPAVVTVSALTKRYGDLTAVDELSFSLEAGTVTGFLGPNGAGKTTTLRLLLGLAEPDSGEALVFGRRYRELDQPTRRVGAVLESNDLHPGRSGRDHLRALALAAELPASRVEEVLELVELEAAAGRRVKTYSLGMRQRLGLAAALLGDPALLVLDEPANGLDPAGVHWLRTFLRRFAEEGGTVLVSSHVLAEVAQTVDRILIIHRGRLLASAPLDQLTERGRTLEDTYLELTAGGAS
jgi:ABC-2 type transport system ATP-binding protein